MYCTVHAFHLLWQLNVCTCYCSYYSFCKVPSVAGVASDALSLPLEEDREAFEEKTGSTKVGTICLKQIDHY